MALNTGSSADAAQQLAVELQLEVHVNEDVMLRQIGNLRQWVPHARSAQLAVAPVTSSSMAVETVRQLGLSFSELAALQVCIESHRWRVGQQLVGGVAELISLQALTLEGGCLETDGLDLHVLTGVACTYTNTYTGVACTYAYTYTGVACTYTNTYTGVACTYTNTYTGLKALTELRIRPHAGKGLADKDLLQMQGGPQKSDPRGNQKSDLTARQTRESSGLANSSETSSTAEASVTRLRQSPMPIGLPALVRLRALEFKGCLAGLTDEGLRSLTTLTNLRELCILPLGLRVTHVGVSHLCGALTSLTSLRLGVAHSGQGDVMKAALPEAGRERNLGLVVADPAPELPGLLATCTLCLLSSLTSLNLPHLKAEDAAFMVALGTLTSLTQLRITVSAANPKTTTPFVINLSTLSQLRKLQHLDVAVVGGQRVGLPVTLKLLSCCALAWPHLTHLLLTCMTSPAPSPLASQLTPHAASAGVGSGVRSSSSAPNLKAQADRRHHHLQQQQQQQQASGTSQGVGVGSAVQGVGWFVQPECLDILDAFPCLTQLALLAPLNDEEEQQGGSSLSNNSRGIQQKMSASVGVGSSWWFGGGRSGAENINNDAGIRKGMGAAGVQGEEAHSWFNSLLPWSSAPSKSGTGHAGERTGTCSPADGLPLIPVALHRLPCTLQHLALERAALWHPHALPPSQLELADNNSQPACCPRGSSSGNAEVLLPDLKALELAQCEVTVDLLKLLFASTQKLACLELVEVHGVSSSSLQALSALISLQHLSVHQHGSTHKHPTASNRHTLSALRASTSAKDGPTSTNPSNSSAAANPAGHGPSFNGSSTSTHPPTTLNSSSTSNRSSSGGVGSLLWGLLGYSSSSAQVDMGHRGEVNREAPQLQPRDLWPIVRELPGLRHLQWVVWQQGRRAGHLQLPHGKVRRRVRVADSATSVPFTYEATQRHHQSQHQQLLRYWQHQCQQQVLLQQQQQQQHPSLPASSSSPALSTAAAASNHSNNPNRIVTTLAGLPLGLPDLASGQLTTAGLVAAAAAARANTAAAAGQQGAGHATQMESGRSVSWVAPGPALQLPPYCALGSWVSVQFLALLLQNLPNLHVAYIDLWESGSEHKTLPIPPSLKPGGQGTASHAGAASKNASSGFASWSGSGLLTRSSSTPAVAGVAGGQQRQQSQQRQQQQHAQAGQGDSSSQGGSASKGGGAGVEESDGKQQGVDTIASGGNQGTGGAAQRGSVASDKAGNEIVGAGPLCALSASSIPPWPSKDVYTGSSFFALDS